MNKDPLSKRLDTKHGQRVYLVVEAGRMVITIEGVAVVIKDVRASDVCEMGYLIAELADWLRMSELATLGEITEDPGGTDYGEREYDTSRNRYNGETYIV